jgi:predicted transcriptional regulator
VAEIFCEPGTAEVTTVIVEHELWQLRAKNAGLPQKLLARLAGVTETNVSLQLRGKFAAGTPTYIKTIIRAWEMLDQAQREALIAATEAGDELR